MSLMSHVTDYGLSRMAQFASGGESIAITHIAVGSGTYLATAQTLANEQARVEITSVSVDETRNQIEVKGTIPQNIGGFTINEIAILDVNGETIALSAGPGFDKPDGTAAGAMGVSITFIVKVARSDAFEIVMPGGGAFLPLSGGEMDDDAKILFENTTLRRAMEISLDEVKATSNTAYTALDAFGVVFKNVNAALRLRAERTYAVVPGGNAYHYRLVLQVLTGSGWVTVGNICEMSSPIGAW